MLGTYGRIFGPSRRQEDCMSQSREQVVVPFQTDRAKRTLDGFISYTLNLDEG